MKIGLYNIDSKMPNLALMKISSYHKLTGDEVLWCNPLEFHLFDKVYASSIFTYSNKGYIQNGFIIGGTGFDVKSKLPQEIDDCEQDYSLYPDFKRAIGFLTRGCIRRCPECFVPEKEGFIRPYRDIEDVAQGRKEIILLDNNVLACEHGLKQIEKALGIRRSKLIDGLYGGDAVLLWRKFMATGDNYFLNLLISYNEEDIINLKTVSDFVCNKLKAPKHLSS